MKRTHLLWLMIVSGAAGGQAPVAPIIQPQLPAECRERDADPEKCVINDGPPPPAIVRKKPAPPPPSAAPRPPVQEPRDGGTRR